MKHLSPEFFGALLAIAVLYNPLGWCSPTCSDCKSDGTGSYTCKNYNCTYFLPETDEEETEYLEYIIVRRERLKTAREESRRKQQHQEQQGAGTLTQPESANSAVNDLIFRLVDEHASFWIVILKAMINYWRRSDIQIALREQRVTSRDIINSAKAYTQNVPGYQSPAAPDNQIPDLLNNVYLQSRKGFVVDQLHANLINQGYSSKSHVSISIAHLFNQLQKLLPQTPGAMGVLTYTFFDDSDKETKQCFIFQLNNQGQVFCFSDVQDLSDEITFLPGIFELIYTTVYDFAPDNGDILTLTLYTRSTTTPNDTDNPLTKTEESDDHQGSVTPEGNNQQHFLDLLTPDIPLDILY